MTGVAHLAYRRAIIATCLRMNALGLNQGSSGNVSLRLPEGFLVTPSGLAYERMRPAQVVQMDQEGGYWGELLPSSEWRLHRDLHRHRPEARAVLHCHSPHATALSCLRRGVPAFHYMVAVAGGDSLRCADYATFGTAELSTAMLAALEGRSACLLANHGMICFAEDLERVLALAVEVETLCRQYLLACQAGAPVLLDAEEMQRVQERFRSYGRRGAGGAAAVDAVVRRDA